MKQRSGVSSLQTEHHNRMNQAVNYIELHLDKPLTLREVARVSAFSPYHFHRLFKQHMNETVHHFIERLRVEKARRMLLFHPERAISDIAFECGLRSSAHFARSFRRMTGLNATEYRQLYSNVAVAARFRSAGRENLELLLDKLKKLEITTWHMPETEVAYIRYVGTINDGTFNEGIMDAFDLLTGWLEARRLAEESDRLIGIVLDDPYITPAGRHRYDACSTVRPGLVPSGDVGVQTLPGGLYAVARFQDHPAYIRDLIHLLFLEWLPGSPYVWDTRPSLEVYPRNAVNLADNTLSVAFMIPVKPR